MHGHAWWHGCRRPTAAVACPAAAAGLGAAPAAPALLLPTPAPHTRRYALPRPEGQRCLVISARGQTVARLRSGVLFERFASRLPGGGPGQGGDDNFCILDCVYHGGDQTYYILGGCCWCAWVGAACVHGRAWVRAACTGAVRGHTRRCYRRPDSGWERGLGPAPRLSRADTQPLTCCGRLPAGTGQARRQTMFSCLVSLQT